jgi:RHS repeat-associated protein
MPGRQFNSNEYKYAYQGSEKDDEISGNGNSYTTHFRELDTRLGRWWAVDPKAMPYESPYASMNNNPIWFNDVLGDEVVNGHKKSRDEAKSSYDKAKDHLSSLDKGDKDYKSAKKELRKAEKAFNRIDEKFQYVQKAIDNLKTYNGDLFNQLNDLKDPGGTTVDVFVESAYGLKSDYFAGSLDPFATPVPLNGGTNVQPIKEQISTDYNIYYSVTSKNGLNTITIALDRGLVDQGIVLSHEGGHGLYMVKHLYEYINWMRENKGKSRGGHGGGNPSGEAADSQEIIYRKNYKNAHK